MTSEQIRKLFDIPMDDLVAQRKRYNEYRNICDDVLKLRRKAGEKTTAQLEREQRSNERPITRDEQS